MNQERIDLLEKFIEEEPNDPFNRYALAMEYYDFQPTRALEILTGLAQQCPTYLPTFFKLAHLQWENESWDLAEEAFTRGIKLAEVQKDMKALSELKSAYQNFQFEK